MMDAGSGNDLIDRRLHSLCGGEFLEGGLGMLGSPALAGEIRLPKLQDESPRRLDPAVQEERSDQCLNDISDDIFTLARIVFARLLAEADERRNTDFTSIFCAGFPVDEGIIALRKIAFRLIGIALVERMGDHHPEYPVAKELKPLVAAAATDARVGEGEVEQT